MTKTIWFLLLACFLSACSNSNSTRPVRLEEKVETLKIGLSMEEVESVLGPGMRDDLPMLFYPLGDGGYWLAFWPVNVGATDPRYRENKLSMVVFYPGKSKDGVIVLPVEQKGQKFEKP